METLHRYLVVKDYVYSTFSKIYNESLRIAAMTHTAQVDMCITQLAMARNENIELAKIAAVFHDFAQYAENCTHDEHARIGSILASKYLMETKLFKTREIDDISFAIAQHSKKETYDSPLAELLKDADVLARFFEDPTKPLEGKRKQRLLDAVADISR